MIAPAVIAFVALVAAVTCSVKLINNYLAQLAHKWSSAPEDFFERDSEIPTTEPQNTAGKYLGG